MSILNHVPPGYTLRPGQVTALLDIEAVWNSSDVIVGEMDVGAGKSLVARVIANWQASKNLSTAIITPRVMLQEQYAASFPDIPVLKGRSHFVCGSQAFSSCADYNDFFELYCDHCPYKKEKIRASEEPVAVFNFQSYMFNRVAKDILVIDEAQSTLDFLAENYTLEIWRHKEKYPDGLFTHGDIAVWLEKRIRELGIEISRSKVAGDKKKVTALTSKSKRYQNVIDGLTKAPTNFFIEHLEDYYRGRKHEQLRVRPNTAKYLPHTLWPKATTKKVVMLSGTFNELDIDRLGLSNRRVTYINTENPIPASQRPFVYIPVANMSFKYQDKSIPKLAVYLDKLAAQHAGEKGIVHISYGMAVKLKPLLDGSRYMFHDKVTKDSVYREFRAATDDKILIACGMAEGIDLLEDAARWQVIAKIMYPSLADELIKRQCYDEPNWYNWQTVRTIRQQTGRIVRSPTDYGVTYMLDSGFRGFFSRTEKFWPVGYGEHIEWRKA